jgi:hypothetical protein
MINLYLQKLIGRIFKILPLREENYDTLSDYISSLLVELHGNEQLINDVDFYRLNGILEYLRTNNDDLRLVKREVFNCINIITAIQERRKQQ